jgi:predicted HTH transcriptional regulator
LPVYVKDKNVLPVMEEEDVFKLTVKYGRGNGVSVPDNFGMLVSGEDKVLALIQENPKITAKEMVEMAEIPSRTIERILAEMTNNKVIERAGRKRFPARLASSR